jgi:acyl-CoA synthetase (NDP forming)
MAHRLDPLLRPRSIAVIGASRRPGSVGHTLIRHLRLGEFDGPVYPVNPNYEDIEGLACYPTPGELPAVPDLAVFAIPDARLEPAFEAALAAGARGAVILSQLVLAEDGEPPLRERIRRHAVEAGVALCGGNSNGLYNFDHKLWVCGFETREDHRPGGVALITHSGSVFNALVDCEARLDYSLAVSSGQELNVGLADYMDFALDQPATRVIGLFMETARDPEGFVAALDKARARAVPVVALKLGRSERGAALAESHSGALVGHDGAYQALFEHYGVNRVDSLDEMAASLMLFAQPKLAAPLGPGGLVTIHDSGGERALIVDLAESLGVPFATLQAETVARLEASLDPGLPAVNPLDAWGTGAAYWDDFTACLTAMMQDPGAALGAVVADRGPDGKIFPEYPHFARAAAEASGKPVMVVSNHQGSGHSPAAVAVTREGIPVLDGLEPFLKGVKHLLAYRDVHDRLASAAPPPLAAPEAVERWRERLAAATALDEREGLALLAEFGVPAVACRAAASRDEAAAAAAGLGYPVALKTAEPGIAHKSELAGVRLALADADALANAYDDLCARLGPRVLVAEMVRGPAVEMILGLVRDPAFGPVVLLGSGGVHAEVLKDVVFALPPFDAETARRLIDRLRLRALLDGVRGQPPADLDAFCRAAASFSALAAALGDRLEALDVNPVLVRPEGCVAVDAFVKPAAGSCAAGASQAA